MHLNLLGLGVRLRLALLFCLCTSTGNVVSGHGEAELSHKALECICEVESNCQEDIGCHPDPDTLSCGAYQLKEVYWTDCGKPGSDFKSCAASKSCSEHCIHEYMERWGTHCTDGRSPTDEDFARIHNGGPAGCKANFTLGYWAKVQACCQTGSGACITEIEEDDSGHGASAERSPNLYHLLVCICISMSLNWFVN